MRMIDADALKKSVLDLHDCDNGFSDTYDKACIIGVIDEEPTIEPKKGTWIADSGMIYCHECRYGYDGIFKRYYNFCPTCGADMRGEQE